MSHRRVPIAATMAAVALLPALAGCGFTPLYAAPGVADGMTHIQVTAPEGRLGYLLREDLDDALGRDKGAAALYRLNMQLAQTRASEGLRADATAQRYELNLRVTYQLIDVSSGKVAHAGTVSSVLSYDSTDQPYAGIAARQDTEDKLATDAAQKIQIEIAAWMVHPHA